MTRSEFEHIAAQLRQRVLKVGLDFFGSKDDAEDAAQEAMIQLWRYCEHIDAERNIEALAVRVAKNCCVSMYRKQQYVADTPKEPLSDRTIDRHQTAKWLAICEIIFKRRSYLVTLRTCCPLRTM